ncbi:hypothetical protein GB937_007152 [Aspergillus fischeri]|nr:hypothetical protein GB937_007152 [Aspergillus fischeri]
MLMGRTWLDRILEDFVNRFDWFIRRRMQNNDNGAKQTQGAAQFPQNAKSFMQKIGPKDSTLRDEVSQARRTQSNPSVSYPINTLSAPSGVTRMAGAKAYAAKLATSPMATVGLRQLSIYPFWT